MLNHRIYKAFTLILFLSSINNCADTFQASYVDADKLEVVDEYWNDADSRKTAEVLIKSMMGKPWLENHMRFKNKRPIVAVGAIVNRTQEHLNTQEVVLNVRNQIINSGRVRFIDVSSRAAIKEELSYQNDSGMVSETTAKEKGRQLGADFLLVGEIHSQVHVKDSVSTVSYSTEMRLTNLETSEIVWTEFYNGIKKKFKNASFGL